MPLADTVVIYFFVLYTVIVAIYVKKMYIKSLFKNKKVWVITIVLAIVGIAGIIIGRLIGEDWKSIVVNISTEIIGISITYFLIDRIIENEEKKKQRSIQRIIFRNIKQELISHFIMLFEIYKASCANKPQNLVLNLKWFLSSEYKNTIKNFNVSAFYIAGGESWLDHFNANFMNFKIGIERTLYPFLDFLDNEQTNQLSNVIGNGFEENHLKIGQNLQNEEILTNLMIYIGKLVSFSNELSKVDPNLRIILENTYLEDNIGVKWGSAKIN